MVPVYGSLQEIEEDEAQGNIDYSSLHSHELKSLRDKIEISCS